MAEKRMFMRDIFESSVMHVLSADNPEFELEAQRVWEALILSADDFGKGRLIYQNIKTKAFGSAPNRYDKITLEMIENWVKLIAKEKAILIYEVDGTQYYYCTGWEIYQSGKWHKRKSNLPDPPEIPSQISQKSPEKVGEVKESKEKKKEKSKKKTETSEDKALRNELIVFCRKIVPRKCGVATQLKKQIDALLLLITSDQHKVDIEKLYTAEKWKEHVFDILEWARKDVVEQKGTWTGWKKVFQSIPRLREDGCDKFNNMRESYLAETKKEKKSPKKIDDPDKFKKTGKEKL